MKGDLTPANLTSSKISSNSKFNTIKHFKTMNGDFNPSLSFNSLSFPRLQLVSRNLTDS